MSISVNNWTYGHAYRNIEVDYVDGFSLTQGSPGSFGHLAQQKEMIISSQKFVHVKVEELLLP